MSDDAIPALGPAQIGAVLEFLPVFEAAGYRFGEWETPEGQFPYFAYSAEVSRFIQTLYAENIVIRFDWSQWQEAAKIYLDDRAALAGADLLTLRKLLTLHVRKDRFVEGHLAAMLESGHIMAILRRMSQIG